MTRPRLLAVVMYALVVFRGGLAVSEDKPTYLDHTLTVDERVQDLVSRMTLEEKVHQMASDAGCRKAARVGGGSILGPLQLRRLSQERAAYPNRHFDSWEEAEAYLDSDEG